MSEITEVINRSNLLGREIDVYGSPNEPLFRAKDVADWIGHSNVSEMMHCVDNEEKLTSTILMAGQKWHYIQNHIKL